MHLNVLNPVEALQSSDSILYLLNCINYIVLYFILYLIVLMSHILLYSSEIKNAFNSFIQFTLLAQQDGISLISKMCDTKTYQNNHGKQTRPVSKS